jgi:hypothetical protein
MYYESHNTNVSCNYDFVEYIGKVNLNIGERFKITFYGLSLGGSLSAQHGASSDRG